ncbi:MAG: type II toxin-antitoxin system RelE/ParE family toxin [Candidatus Bathyarchaeota archaeon]|nr:type II toxin-antitoxin system RelE/ParE family toxin [Candidatus Termitimicrobium sp.]
MQKDLKYRVKLYRDQQGRRPIKEYLDGLASKTDKSSRIKLGSIDYHLQALRKYGTRAGEKIVKHIVDDIWELRPLKDRIFFFYWKDDTFILLHHFHKKTQKTPPQEIEQAKRNLRDFIERSKNDGRK